MPFRTSWVYREHWGERGILGIEVKQVFVVGRGRVAGRNGCARTPEGQGGAGRYYEDKVVWRNVGKGHQGSFLHKWLIMAEKIKAEEEILRNPRDNHFLFILERGIVYLYRDRIVKGLNTSLIEP